MDLFPTQRATRASVGVHRGAEREHFKFASDEKQNSDAFDKDVSQCIDSVAAEWKTSPTGQQSRAKLLTTTTTSCYNFILQLHATTSYYNLILQLHTTTS